MRDGSETDSFAPFWPFLAPFHFYFSSVSALFRLFQSVLFCFGTSQVSQGHCFVKLDICIL